MPRALRVLKTSLLSLLTSRRAVALLNPGSGSPEVPAKAKPSQYSADGFAKFAPIAQAYLQMVSEQTRKRGQ